MTPEPAVPASLTVGSHHRPSGLGLAAGLLAAAAFATSGPFVKPLLVSGWTAGGAIIVRLTIGAVLLTVPTLLALRGARSGSGGALAAVRRSWRWILVFGVAGVAAPSGLYFLAVERLPVAVALLVEYTGPLLLIAWSWLRTRRPPNPGVLVGASLAMLGLVGVLDLTGAIRLDPLGLVFAVVAAFGNAAYFAITARPLPLPPVAMAGLGMWVGAATVALIGLVGLLPVSMATTDVTLLGSATPFWVPLLVIGALPTAVAYGVSVVSVRLLGERVASFLALSEVLFAVLLAWLLLREAPTPVQWLGGAGVVAGVALVRRFADVTPDDVTPDDVTPDYPAPPGLLVTATVATEPADPPSPAPRR